MSELGVGSSAIGSRLELVEAHLEKRCESAIVLVLKYESTNKDVFDGHKAVVKQFTWEGV